MQESIWPRLAFEVLPLVAGSAVLAAAGMRWLRTLVIGLNGAVMAGLGLLAFLGLLTFKKTRGWNVLLLGFFSVIAGAVIGASLPVMAANWWESALRAGLAALAGGVTGAAFGAKLAGLSKPLWVLAWIYLVGLLLIWAGRAWDVRAESWGLAGAAVFTGLVSVRVARWRSGGLATSSAAEAADLVLLMANLLLAIGVWTAGLAP